MKNKIYNDTIYRISEIIKSIVKSLTTKEVLPDIDSWEQIEKQNKKGKHKSMCYKAEEEKAQRRILSIASKNIHGISNFIQLVSYMVMETQIKIQ